MALQPQVLEEFEVEEHYELLATRVVARHDAAIAIGQ